MAGLTLNHPMLKEQQVSCHTASFGSTPIAANVRAPCRGKIVNLIAVVNAAFTGTLTVTTSIIPAAADGVAPGAGTAVTGGAFTMSATNSASGSTNSIVPTALNFVNEGDIINFVPSGATATAGPASFYAVIQAA
jgi:hypothetical protein